MTDPIFGNGGKHDMAFDMETAGMSPAIIAEFYACHNGAAYLVFYEKYKVAMNVVLPRNTSSTVNDEFCSPAFKEYMKTHAPALYRAKYSDAWYGNDETTAPKVCRFFNTSNGCRYGASCTFQHVATTTTPPSAGRGASCTFQHVATTTTPPPVASRVCRFFNTSNGCRHGASCTFQHVLE